jgi:hypothetical protein
LLQLFDTLLELVSRLLLIGNRTQAVRVHAHARLSHQRPTVEKRSATFSCENHCKAHAQKISHYKQWLILKLNNQRQETGIQLLSLIILVTPIHAVLAHLLDQGGTPDT